MSDDSNLTNSARKPVPDVGYTSGGSFRLPPGPRGWVAPTVKMIFDPVESFRAWQERFGPTFTVSRLGQKIVVTSDPELIQQIYSVKDTSLFAATVQDTVDVLLGKESILLMAGEEHQKQRKLMSPPFHGDRVKDWAKEIADSAERAFDVEGETQALRCAQQATLDIIVQVVFGVREKSRRAEYVNMMRDWVDALRPTFLFLRAFQRNFLGLSSYARYRRLSEEVDRLLNEQIARVRSGSGDGTDVLSGLVKARYDDGSSLSDASIRAQLRTLLFAGHDTTAISIAWSIYYVMKNEAVRERLLAELDALGNVDPGEYIRLPYLAAVFDETLRIRPVTVDIMRLLRKPWRLGEWTLPPGVAVSAIAPLTHLRGDLWPEPNEFKPERFLGKPHSPSIYLPFGGGAYRCIGAQFARVEHCVILGTILRKYRFELLDEQEGWGRGLALLRPSGGVRMRVSKRADSSATG